MFGQTVTLYHKSYDGDKTKWARHELTGVQLSLADGTTISTSGELTQGGSVLVVRKQADMERVGNGDYIVSGSCPVAAFEGNPGWVCPDARLRPQNVPVPVGAGARNVHPGG